MKIILLLLLSTFVYAQYGRNEINFITPTACDGEFDSATGWGLTAVTISGGNATYNPPANPMRYQSVGNLAKQDATGTYLFVYEISTITTGSVRIDNISGDWTGNGPSHNTTGVKKFELTSVSATGLIRHSGDANTDAVVEYIRVRQKLPVLYIATGGDDTAMGEIDTPIATGTEAMNRGVHLTGSGTFAFSGVFSENLTIPGNFGTIRATGPTLITQIDFASYTGIVDLTNLTITTTLNDENITYLSDQRKYKKYKIYGNYKD